MIQIDMGMPDSCRECWFLKYDMNSGETSCVIEDMILARYFKALDFEGRHEECPLVDVPDINVGNCSEIPNSSDCISRQTTADEIGKRAERCAERFGTDDPFWEGLMIAKNIVECAPFVRPERKKGKET